jgi:hypothetical protein
MESTQARHEDGAAGGQTLAALGRHLSEESSRLARLEVELAKAELAQKGKQIGIGAGAFGTAGILGLCALGALTAAAILGLATALEPWLAAVAVAGALGALAGTSALFGKSRIDAGTPPAPERAISSSRQDIERTKQSIEEARR